ncbi:Palmitoyl-protein thioesterase 1 [Sesamum angolense]|uniref:Palmitoyl-protein thioesterase 1 n=1 Tax=Sesamum angolense TaxID=2727404 RepID=A0AAE1WA13_9LAMI|nr:Palmitoyl-protein thioesterase 1 [Sesamum angolense]
MNANDTVIKPKESSWFGYYADGGFGTILQPQETKLYTEDWIGLKTLDKAGRVKFIKAAGAHIDMSDADIKKYVVPYLRGSRRRPRPDVDDSAESTGSEEVATIGN